MVEKEGGGTVKKVGKCVCVCVISIVITEFSQIAHFPLSKMSEINWDLSHHPSLWLGCFSHHLHPCTTPWRTPAEVHSFRLKPKPRETPSNWTRQRFLLFGWNLNLLSDLRPLQILPPHFYPVIEHQPPTENNMVFDKISTAREK